MAGKRAHPVLAYEADTVIQVYRLHHTSTVTYIPLSASVSAQLTRSSTECVYPQSRGGFVMRGDVVVKVVGSVEDSVGYGVADGVAQVMVQRVSPG